MTEPGLCGTCGHARTFETARGSRFLLCEWSRTDPRFPRYPALPVLRSTAFDQGTSDPADSAPRERDHLNRLTN